jgi:hypothetical protein
MTTEALPAERARPGVAYKAVALPAEHGGWGLIGEPLILGVVLAPSWAACGLVLAALAAFLLHHPLKLLLADLRRGNWYARTGAALGFAGAYTCALSLGVLAACATARGPFWWPLLAASPLALLQLAYDARNQSRALAPQVAGATALAAAAPAVLLASGWVPFPAAVVWGLCAARSVSSVLYVRARLRLDRKLPVRRSLPLAVHVATLSLVAGLWHAHHAGLATVAAFGLLAVRATWGLSARHAVVEPRVVGFQELGLGLTTTVLLCLGQWPRV